MDIALLSVLTGAGQMGNGIANAFAESSQSNFIAQQFKFNEDIAKIQTEEATLQGREEQQVSQERTAQLGGAQQAAEAAQGVDVTTGTPAITRFQTSEIGGLDYLTIGNNAFLKGMGYKISALNDQTQATLTEEEGANKSINSLFQGGEELYQGGIKAVAYNDPKLMGQVS